ncbi:hypothetical protein GCM10010466_63700 [Planomonospora alba]|uniref:Uncharacterized protein n=1 Tax=Planomonospora alba TaxID=161354 RepID=A0ABP6P3J4_9ACTN
MRMEGTATFTMNESMIDMNVPAMATSSVHNCRPQIHPSHRVALVTGDSITAVIAVSHSIPVVS